MLVPDTVGMASFPGPHQSTSPRPAGVPRGSAALQLSTIDGGMLSQTAPGERQATTCDSAVAILSPRDTTQGDCHAQAADSRDASDASSPIGGALLKRKLEIQSERQYQRSFALPVETGFQLHSLSLCFDLYISFLFLYRKSAGRK